MSMAGLRVGDVSSQRACEDDQGKRSQADVAQMDRLVRRYEHRVRFFVRKVERGYMLGQRWSDELVSAGYWGLFKALRNRRAEASECELSAYVSQRIHGAVIDAARTCLGPVRRREVLHAGADEAERDAAAVDELSVDALQAPEADPEQLAASVWRESAIRAALATLEPDELRIVQAYMEGASLSEIAREEGLATGTLQARFRRTTSRLRARMPELRRILLDRDAG